MIKFNRFLPQQLLPNTHMLSKYYWCNVWWLKLMHKNWAWKVWSKCELALYSWWRWFALITPDSSTRHTPVNLSWASNCIQELMQKNRRKDLGKLRKQTINSCNRKQFITVPKLGGFGLIIKFRSRASTCKKNQVNRSNKTQVMIKRRFKFKLAWTKFWIFQNYV